ncbi:XAP5-domain-containing protein, partial [Saccharata proteae CBS 121410]
APSRSATPSAAEYPQFTSQQATAEDLLKSQTVGLVNLSDFRKRRAEALLQREKEEEEKALGQSTGSAPGSGTTTPAADCGSTPRPAKKKRKNNLQRGKLSFGLDEEEEAGNGDGTSAVPTPARSKSNTPAAVVVDDDADEASATAPTSDVKESSTAPKKRLGPNANVSVAPKVMTKSALLREAQAREQLRKEFLVTQEAVKATEFAIPFIFYDGTHMPGGVCKMKKGDPVWLFLDKARKMGAQLGVGGNLGGSTVKRDSDKNRREWARVSVDDLLLVRGDIIIPHRYDFYYFMLHASHGFHGPIFPHSATPTPFTPSLTSLTSQQSPSYTNSSTYDPLARDHKQQKADKLAAEAAIDPKLEGFDEDPEMTKVVDRRWYDRNKHIFPASRWEEFDPEKDYKQGVRKDGQGNAFFFS